MWNVTGYDEITRPLKSTLEKGLRHHAYLITGRSQSGKKLLALDIARTLNCTRQQPPCNRCDCCQRISELKHADVYLTELATGVDGQESRTAIGVDEVEDIQHAASLPPFESECKVFIIDGADKLSAPAASRLLKTLEEPPGRVVFILLAETVESVMPTVVSRCQLLELKPVSTGIIRQLLEEAYDVPSSLAGELASLSIGRIGWAVNAARDKQVLEEYYRKRRHMLEIINGDILVRFRYAEEMATRFTRNRTVVYDELQDWLVLARDLLLAALGIPDLMVNKDISSELERISEQYTSLSLRDLVASVDITRQYLKKNVNARLALEAMFLTLPVLAGAPSINV